MSCIIYSQKILTKLRLVQVMIKKRETTDGVISNPYHIGSGIVCKENLMRHLKIKRLNITINFDLSQEKMHRNTIQTDHKFLIIHTRY